jgi:hypothetical protein
MTTIRFLCAGCGTARTTDDEGWQRLGLEAYCPSCIAAFTAEDWDEVGTGLRPLREKEEGA